MNSWEPVPDAGSYDVWRTDTESSSQVLLTTTSITPPAALSLVDNVTVGTGVEKLADGRTYKYIVVATPGAARLVGGVSSAQEDIYSGKGEATVTANIPDPVAFKVPQAAGIDYRVDPDGTLYVSWTQPANAKAAVGYFPGGYPGDLTLDAFTSVFTSSGGTALFPGTDAGYLYPRNAATVTFPIIGGKATIAIQTAYFNGTMYAKDKPATLEITLDQYDLDLKWLSTPSPALTATYVYQTAATGKVQLSWPRVQGDEDVYSDTPYTAKTAYRVWKRATALNQDSLGTVSGDWTEVTYTSVDPADGHTGNTINAIEDVGAITGEWEYIVYASAARGDKASHSYPLVGTLTRTVAEANISTAAVSGNNNVMVSGTNVLNDPYTAKIDVSGLKPGVSYTLYRGELTPIASSSPATTSSGYQFTAYDTAPVHTWTGQPVLSDTSAAIYDTGIAPRKSYRYKLVSSLSGTPLGDGSVKDVIPSSTSDLASVYSSLSLNVSNDGLGNANRGRIRASVTNTGYTAGMDVKLFYRRTNTTNPAVPAVTEWTPYPTSFGRIPLTVDDGHTQTTDKDGVFEDLEVAVPSPGYGENYEFRAVAYLNNREIPNLNNSSYSGAAVTDATGTSPLSTAYISDIPYGAQLTTLSSHTITGIYGSYLDGARIDLRVVPANLWTGKPTHYDQAQGALTMNSGILSDYTLTFTLTGLTANQNLGTPGSPDDYVLYWKYPWEKWEDTTISWTDARVVRNIFY